MNGDPRDGRHDHLGDAILRLNQMVFLPVIHEKHRDFAPVIFVDRSRSVEDGDAMAKGQARTRTDLAFMPKR